MRNSSNSARGSLEKIRVLLDAFAGNYANAPARYVPVDISADYLHGAAARLRAAYPWLDVAPIAADYTKAEQLAELTATPARRIGFFPVRRSATSRRKKPMRSCAMPRGCCVAAACWSAQIS